MRTAVYQRNLETYGGGERYTLDFARHLADAGHDVDLLAPSGSVEEAGRRFGIDVSGIRQVSVEARRPCQDASERSAAYDLFVNVTHASQAASLAKRGVLVVHFPSPPPPPSAVIAEAVVRGPGGAARSGAYVHEGHGTNASPDTQGVWTMGSGVVRVGRYGPDPWKLRLTLARRTGTWRGGQGVRVVLDGLPVKEVKLPPRGVRHVTVDLPATRGQFEHALSLELIGEPGLERMTGWPLGVHVRRLDLRAAGCEVVPVGAPGRGRPELASYDALVANAEYTRGWVQTRWGRDARVVHPVVHPIAPRAKEQSIVVVGRFFSGGHSKRQLELARVFKQLCDDGLEGWRLDLVGGSDPLYGGGYVEQVRAAASGYPIDVVVNASRAELEARVGAAAFVWQASGWGQDEETTPESFEHFGIALGEAMGAGAVPVALGVGGPREIVRDGVDGVLWQDSPAADTLALIADDARRAAMSASAIERAEAFGPQNFAREAARVLA